MGEWVDEELVGGPMDGTCQPMEYTALYGDPAPGAWLGDDRKAPPEVPGARAVHEPEAGGDPLRWTWPTRVGALRRLEGAP